VYDYYERQGLEFRNPSRTKQSFRAESDINNIMRRFEKTGILPDLIKSDPKYGDFSTAPSYQESLHLVMKAHAQFESLSSKIRDRFNNDPERFLNFASDPSNTDEMVRLGLAVARSTPTPSQPIPTPPKAGQADPDPKVNA